MKKIFSKIKRCIIERRWPRLVFLERALHAVRMRFETIIFNLRVSESGIYARTCGRKYLYASPVGQEGKERLAEVISRFGHQDFDYLIFAWDDVRFDEDVFKKCTVIYEKGRKWFFIKKYLTPDFCRKYAYLFLWDDDLEVKGFDYRDFIAIMKHNKLQVAQPALSKDSYATHAITLRQKNGVGRYVDFVEIMAQVFHESAWRSFWGMMEEKYNFWGFGYDNLARAVCFYKNMGIIDRQPIRHARPCRENHLAAQEGGLFSSRFSRKQLAKQVSYWKLKSPPEFYDSKTALPSLTTHENVACPLTK